MPTTTSADLIVPEVWEDALAPLILGNSVMAQLADTDDTLVGQPGDTVIFPKWDYIGDAVDLTENVAMSTRQMAQSDARATIKEVGTAVELTERALLTAIGQPNSQAQVQLATSVARKIDADLRLEAERITGTSGQPGYSSPLVVGGTAAPLSWDRLVSGIALMGDQWNPTDMAGIVIHSADHAALLRDPLFISAESFGQGAVLQRGQIGSIGTIPVFISDRATVAGTGHNTLLIKRGSLALKYKKRPEVRADDDILKRTKVLAVNAFYATKRTDDRGVVVIPTAAAA